MDELTEPELMLEDSEALAVPLPAALVDGPERVFVKLTEPDLDTVKLHDALPEDVLAERVADEGWLWEALEPEAVPLNERVLLAEAL